MGWQEKITPELVHCFIVLLFVVHGCRGLDLASSPVLSADPPHAREIASTPADLPKSQTVYAPPPITPPKGSDSHAPVALPPSFRATSPTINPLIPTVKPPAPSTHSAIEHNSRSVISPSTDGPAKSPIRPGHHLSPSYASPPPKSDVSSSTPISNSPVILPPAPAPPRILPVNPPSAPNTERITPSAAPAGSTGDLNGHAISPSSIPPVNHGKSHDIPVAPPPVGTSSNISPVIHSPLEGSSPLISPVPHKAAPSLNTNNAPLNSHAQPPKEVISLGPASAPAVPMRKHSRRKRVPKHVFAPSYPPPYIPGPVVSPPPKVVSTKRPRHHASPPSYQGPSESPIQSPFSSVSSPLPSSPNKGSNHHPSISPSGPLSTVPRAPVAQPVWTLPPPPPNLDCNSLSCTEPLTDPPIGSPCVCVLPIKVGLRLSVALYSFFPLVSDFAQEIASGVDMKQRQVRVMGANVASEQPEKTAIIVDLVPLEEKFDNSTAFQTFEKFWHKKVAIKASLFGDYEVLYILYPGLPSSPPTAPTNVNVEDGRFGNNRNARAMKPLGVDVTKPKRKANGSLIAIVVLSSFLALLLCTGAALLLVLKWGDHFDLPERFQHSLLPQFAKSSGTGHMILGTQHSSASASFSSSIATYTGQAKTFKLSEIERATNFFGDSRILGEGGFGCVYRGELEDGTAVAVKVLKRYDCQGEREFLSEVEMLSRLHHRNLVKLTGICIEENARCLIYELIPNGSVESHLHGPDKETAPLDWNARMKIALGAARGLAYLHEDSNPRVIHRDFKSSNILLEPDFTPKVSDFGLARAAMDEGNQHISTRVMGTFGYVAPEYAMTGHLLVKSDVYSYGVVLLELLTGRKPVDMSRPAGQENLVTWARPLLTSADGLEEIIDPSLDAEVQFDSVAKVAAIASMCVQPEVSHRPFMGEVVQALKLVCSECNSQERLPGPVRDISNEAGVEAERVLLSDMFGTPPMSSGDEHGTSFHRHSCSGPLTTGKNKQFWQRLQSLRTGSMSDHGLDSLGLEAHSVSSGGHSR